MQQPLTADHPNAVAVWQAEQAAGRGDTKALQNVHAENMVVHNSPFGGDAVGREALYAQNTLMFQKAGGTLNLQPYHVIGNDELVIVSAKVTGRRGSRVLDQMVLEVWRMEEGKCVEVWDHFSDQSAWDAFWK